MFNNHWYCPFFCTWCNNGNYMRNIPGINGITVDEAIRIALQQVPGQVVKVELDRENGVLVYEVYIRTPGGRLYEVKVNAATGFIVEVDLEN